MICKLIILAATKPSRRSDGLDKLMGLSPWLDEAACSAVDKVSISISSLHNCKKRGSERERERETERDRETERQRDRETERQRETEAAIRAVL